MLTQPDYLINAATQSPGDSSDQFSWYGTGKPTKPAPEGYSWTHTGTRPTYNGWNYGSSGVGFASPDASSNDTYGVGGFQNIYTAMPNAPQQSSFTPETGPAPAEAAPEQPAATPFWQTSAADQYRKNLANQYGSLTDALNEVYGQLPYVDYWDEAGVQSLLNRTDALRQMREDARRYIQSQNYGQAYGPGMVRPNFQGLESRWKDYLKKIAELPRQQRQERIGMQEWGNKYGDLLSDWQGQMGGLGLNEYDTWNTISNALKQMQTDWESQGFRMDPSGLGGIFGRADALQGDLADWEGRYGEEKARVDSARQMFADMLGDTMSGLGGLDIYSGEMLGGAEDDISRALREIQGFESELAPNFSDLISQLQQGQRQVQGLRNERTARLEDMMGQASQYSGDIAGADLWNEEAMRKALDELYGMTGDIGRFTGGQAPNFMDQLQAMIEGGEGRLDELGQYRTGIESSAQEFLDRIREEGLDVAGLHGLSPEVEAMLAEMEQYGATQASDELDAIQQWIQGDIARQQAAAQALAQRQREEAEQYNQITSQGPTTLGTRFGNSPIWGMNNPFTGGSYVNNDVLRALGIIG